MSTKTKVITPEDFVRKLRAIQLAQGNDPEAIHSESDDLMCTLLRQLGYEEGVEIFESMEKWYA